MHHRDCDKSNNVVPNLITLCERCHHSLHGVYTKKELRNGDIFFQFAQIKKKKIKEKLLFLEKLKNKVKIKPKRFFNV